MSSRAADQLEERFIENPDRAAVYELMRQTWRRPAWEHTPELLSAYIDRPTGDPSLSVGLAYGDRLVAYLAYVPYVIRYVGRRHRIVYATFWTADGEFRTRGVALKLMRELLRRSRKQSYAGVISVTHADTDEDRTFQFVLHWIREDYRIIHRFGQLMSSPHIIRQRTQSAGEVDVQPYLSGLRDGCLALLQKTSDRAELARTFDAEDVDFILRGRPNTRTWVYHDGTTVRGLINVMRKKLLAQREAINAHIEHIAFGELNQETRLAFLASVFRNTYWESIDAVYAPRAGYYDQGAFKEAGFYEAIRKFNLYFVPLDGSLQMDEVSSFCLDVF